MHQWTHKMWRMKMCLWYMAWHLWCIIHAVNTYMQVANMCKSMCPCTSSVFRSTKAESIGELKPSTLIACKYSCTTVQSSTAWDVIREQPVTSNSVSLTEILRHFWHHSAFSGVRVRFYLQVMKQTSQHAHTSLAFLTLLHTSAMLQKQAKLSQLCSETMITHWADSHLCNRLSHVSTRCTKSVAIFYAIPQTRRQQAYGSVKLHDSCPNKFFFLVQGPPSFQHQFIVEVVEKCTDIYHSPPE